MSARRDDQLGLDLKAGELHEAILTLADVGYVVGDIKYQSGPGAPFKQLHVTGRGQQAFGEWPLFDEIASPDTLALLLERLAEEAPTDEEANNLRRAATVRAKPRSRLASRRRGQRSLAAREDRPRPRVAALTTPTHQGLFLKTRQLGPFEGMR